MSPRTVFLSKLIGLFSLFFGVSMLVNKQMTVTAVGTIFQDPALVLVLGVIVLSAGLALVISHNVWSGGAAIVVTLVGWLTLVKGLILLFLSPAVLTAYFQALNYERMFYVYAAILLILGLFLTSAGYRAKTQGPS
ncbi:MAG TPA: hypothetical protein VEJ41_04365 [Candidatus Acidoferrales bacterium]|nr:hypothetical protein [Candidatus Acidoferrales bacterium]